MAIWIHHKILLFVMLTSGNITLMERNVRQSKNRTHIYACPAYHQSAAVLSLSILTFPPSKTNFFLHMLCTCGIILDCKFSGAHVTFSKISGHCFHASVIIITYFSVHLFCSCHCCTPVVSVFNLFSHCMHLCCEVYVVHVACCQSV